MESMFRLPDDQVLRRLDLAAKALRDGRTRGEYSVTARGPSAFSRQLGRSEARVRDLGIVFQRLLDEPLNAFELDYETLRHFSVLMLDEWARTTGHLAGVDKPHHFDFSALVETLDSASVPRALVPLRETLLRHVRWLHFWLWTYRNESVDAEPRPMRTVAHGADNDNVGAGGDSMPNRARALLTRVVENITNLERPIDRERIASLAAEAALHAPSFEVVASVVADFVSRSVPAVFDAASARPVAIDLVARRARRASTGARPSSLP
jgi:hypothetical protein